MLYRIVVLLVSFLGAGILHGQVNPRWLRYSSISPDGKEIVFTYRGDLFRVPATGGTAIQLTFHEAHDYMPVWSKDGKKIAFASDRYGNFDVYWMDAMGGPAQRLTYHSNDEHPYTFSADNSQVVFGAIRQDKASHRQYPHSSQTELYQVPTSGGRVAQLLTFPAELAQFSKDGSTMIYQDKKGGENEWRKHHTSSITRDIWRYDLERNEHEMIINWKGEDRNPVFSADEQAIFYLSEESGTFNVHRYDVNSGTTRQVTDFDLHPVRFLSAGAGTLCFSYDGELYTLSEAGTEPQKVAITIRTQVATNPDQFIAINGGIREMDISPDGKEIAFIARGEVFVTSVDGKLTKRITSTAEQERFVKFGPDGKSIVYSREQAGRWHIFQTTRLREKEEPFFFASTLLEEKPLISNDGDNYLAEFSPDGKKMAFVENRRSIKILHLARRDTVTILTEDDLYHMRDGDQYYRWSPDSKWLLIEWGRTLSNSEVLLVSADGKQRINLTDSGYGDYRPKWVNEGQQMLWLSNRNGLRSYATSGSTQRDVYSMFFTQDAWDEFQLSEEEYDLQKAIAKAASTKAEKSEDKKEDEQTIAVADLSIDWKGLEDRKARLTIHSSALGDAVLSKDNQTLYYLARFEKGMNLWSTNLRTKETKQVIKLNAGSGSLMWDKKRENLYLLANGRIAKVEPEKGKQTAIKLEGEVAYHADEEIRAMFDHVWLRTRAIFYEPSFHGIDWDLMRTAYEKYLPHIGNGYEFSEMISEMLGELNVSHAGGRYSHSIAQADATASLGIFMDYDYSGVGIRIEEIIKGGPLDKAAFEVSPGMIIEAIDGEQLVPERDVASYLNRKAEQLVLLELVNPTTEERIQITVKPISLAAERRLLYDRWVKINAAEVAEKSSGQLGYVHIPGMSDGPYRDVYDKMLGKYADKAGIIVDTRFNGGGDLVADLAMFFTGESFITYATAAKVVGGEPTARWTKPTLAIYNESMYSDGHCFASAYSELGIGKTVGMPVPGTCSFAGWERLPNGGRWGVVPVSAKNKAGEWMENNQTAPDFEVKNMPGFVDQGRDQQLEKAIEELLKDIK